MASKFTYDTTNKLFLLNSGVTSLDAKTEFYSWVKYDWLTTPSLAKFRFPIESIGGQDIGGGVTISPYYSLLYGWRIAPPAADLTLNVIGNIITAEGVSPYTDTAGPYHHVFTSQVSANSLTTGGALTPENFWDLALEGTYTGRQLMRAMAATLLGKASGAPDGPIVFRDANDTKARVTATVDGSGNRSAVTLDVG